MKRRGLQLSPLQRRALYSSSVLLLLSGVVWAWLHRLDESGVGSETLRHWKPWFLKVHGFAAVGFVLLLGTLLRNHVRRAWHARKNWGNGAFFLTATSLLVLSGYALYYIGDETWRSAASQFHLWLGVASPVLLVIHIRSGHRAVR